MIAEIPDKIYIRHYWMPGELDDEWRLKPVEDEQCEEYIRKDALLEWLNEMLTNTANALDFRANCVYGKVIDKLNSM